MLLEKRHQEIVKLVEVNKSVTLQELMDIFKTSESTIRRDILTLHQQGQLIKVFGGAVALGEKFKTTDEAVAEREIVNKQIKLKIAKYAASMIKKDDFVYLDAGTTTGYMIDYINQKEAIFVTNGAMHARRLSDRGFKVLIIGGEFKGSTEAVVGGEALYNLEKYNFTIGFFGTNGVNRKKGYTTPDLNEALTKKKAMEKTDKRYILCDSSKFGDVSLVAFADFNSAVILTDYIPKDSFEDSDNIISIR